MFPANVSAIKERTKAGRMTGRRDLSGGRRSEGSRWKVQNKEKGIVA
jgi:hypothetical protein